METNRLKAFCAAVTVISLAMTGCGHPPASGPSEIVLFNGTGTTPNGVAVIEKILSSSSPGELAARNDFSTPASAANAYAATLIDAALNGKKLPHY